MTWLPIAEMDRAKARDVFLVVEEYGERMPTVGYVDVMGGLLITPLGDIDLVDLVDPVLTPIYYMEVPGYEGETV